MTSSYYKPMQMNLPYPLMNSEDIHDLLPDASSCVSARVGTNRHLVR